MNKNFYPTDEQLLIMKHLESRLSIREITKKIGRGNSPHWTHLELQKLELGGYVRNARPGKALGWVNTEKGRQVLRENGLLK